MRSRALLVLVALVGCALCLSCHDDVNPSALTPTFVAGAAPVDNSITIQPVSVDGDLITVAVYAQAVENLFGVSFDLPYDSGVLFFLGVDGTDSILLNGITEDQALFDATGAPPSYNVVATRLDFALGGVSTTGPVVLLNFRATGTAASSAIHLANFRFTQCVAGEACTELGADEEDLDLLAGGSMVITGP